MPFKEVLEFLQSKNLTHLAPSVARLKISDQKALLELDAATLTKQEWDPTDITLLLRATGKEVSVDNTPLIPVPRNDFPKLEPRGRGSLKRAIGAAFPNCRMSSIAALQEDFYANSSQASQASLWNTWNDSGYRMGFTTDTHHKRTPTISGSIHETSRIQIP